MIARRTPTGQIQATFNTNHEKRLRQSQNLIKTRNKVAGSLKENDDLRDFLVTDSNNLTNKRKQS